MIGLRGMIAAAVLALATVAPAQLIGSPWLNRYGDPCPTGPSSMSLLAWRSDSQYSGRGMTVAVIPPFAAAQQTTVLWTLFALNSGSLRINGCIFLLDTTTPIFGWQVKWELEWNGNAWVPAPHAYLHTKLPANLPPVTIYVQGLAIDGQRFWLSYGLAIPMPWW